MMSIPKLEWMGIGDDWTSHVLSSLPSTWPHTWQEDNRLPLFTFLLLERPYGFYCFSIPFWVQLIAILLIECLVAIPTAITIYYFIIQPQINGKRRRMGTTNFGYLIGWGFLLPLWIILPGPISDELNIVNLIARFSVCVITPTVSIFRLLAAMYGFVPDYACRSCGCYAFYFCSPLIIEYDPTTGSSVKATARRMITHLGKFLGYLLLTGVYQSLFEILDSFPSYGLGPASTPAEFYQWSSIFEPSIWKESILYAILFQMYLCSFSQGLMFATNLLTGSTTPIFMDNPIFGSRSPSDFWGRRWNLLIHTCLKNGVFKPIRALGGSQGLAVLCAFVASALFHEWLLPTVFHEYPSTHGPTLFFFLWQAMLVSGENVIGSRLTFVTEKIPRILQTAMVISMGIPVAHWFMDSYIRSDFFIHGQVGIFMILPMS